MDGNKHVGVLSVLVKWCIELVGKTAGEGNKTASHGSKLAGGEGAWSCLLSCRNPSYTPAGLKEGHQKYRLGS